MIEIGVLLYIALGAGAWFVLSIVWGIGGWGLPKISQTLKSEAVESTVEYDEAEKGMTLVELAELPKYQCKSCCGAPSWEHLEQGQCGRCGTMCWYVS